MTFVEPSTNFSTFFEVAIHGDTFFMSIFNCISSITMKKLTTNVSLLMFKSLPHLSHVIVDIKTPCLIKKSTISSVHLIM